MAATPRFVLASGRDVLDISDDFRCFNAKTGKQLWEVSYPSPGRLDYGNTPRSTPMIQKGRVYFQGALGDLTCAKLETGEVLWRRNLILEFFAEMPTWGVCGTPLLVNDKLIVQPGSATAAIAALDPATGKTLWQTPGKPSGYSSCIQGTFGKLQQIIGYDEHSLGGWDITTGKRLWTVTPDIPGDFNVPTPVQLDKQHLLVTTENNGTRIYQFNEKGFINPKPIAEHEDLSPDSQSPVVINGKVYGSSSGLFCLDTTKGLKELWQGDDQTFYEYCSLLGSEKRILTTSIGGELLLLDITKDKMTINSRLPLVKDGSETHAHPAIVGKTLYVRIGKKLLAVALG